MFALRKIILLLFCMICAHAGADDASSEYIVRRSPTMAVFYSVEPDGRAVRESVDTAMIADPDAKPSKAVIAGTPQARHQARRQRAPRVTATITVATKRHDSFAEFRCERYGFYYTSAAECIAPAGVYLYERAADMPEAASNKGNSAVKPVDPVFSGWR